MHTQNLKDKKVPKKVIDIASKIERALPPGWEIKIREGRYSYSPDNDKEVGYCSVIIYSGDAQIPNHGIDMLSIVKEVMKSEIKNTSGSGFAFYSGGYELTFYIYFPGQNRSVHLSINWRRGLKNKRKE